MIGLINLSPPSSLSKIGFFVSPLIFIITLSASLSSLSQSVLGLSLSEAQPAKSLMRARVNTQLSMITAPPFPSLPLSMITMINSTMYMVMCTIHYTIHIPIANKWPDCQNCPVKINFKLSSEMITYWLVFMLLSPVESNQLLWRDSIRLDVFIMDMSVPINPLDNLKLIWHLPSNWKQLGT